MYENYMKSDKFVFILLSATLIVAITIAYAIKKWLFTTYGSKSDTTIAEKSSKTYVKDGKNGDLNSNYTNGNAIKVCVNNYIKPYSGNDFDKVPEDLIVCNPIVKPLDCELKSNGLDNKLDIDLPLSYDTIKGCDIKPNESPKPKLKSIKRVNICEELNKEINSSKSEQSLDKESNLAAIVLTDELRSDWSEVICITSGSGIIDKTNLEPEFVVVDCRAPVLARRCLIRYMYRKLNELVKQEVTEEESLFTAIPASNRFQLKSSFKVNLYLSEAPDSWKSNNRHISNGIINESKRRSAQLVRLKSTTDKISLWNEVGIQGSLLSHFVDTIYIYSVIIPVEFNERSFHRHFIVNYTKEPKLLKCENILIKCIAEKVNSLRTNECQNHENVATNWIQTDDCLEVIDCKTGKAIAMNESNQHLIISRLSKHELNKCFRQLVTNIGHNLRPHQSLPMTYRQWKESSPNYRIQKQLLKVRYAVAGRQWTAMASDLDMFV